jgi:hypothetical protein
VLRQQWWPQPVTRHLGLLLQVGHDGEMIRWPDAVDRAGAGQLH